MDCARTNPKVKSRTEALGNISSVLVDQRTSSRHPCNGELPTTCRFASRSSRKRRNGRGLGIDEWIATRRGDRAFVARLGRARDDDSRTGAVELIAFAPSPTCALLLFIFRLS
jgi:hypothetical protein